LNGALLLGGFAFAYGRSKKPSPNTGQDTGSTNEDLQLSTLDKYGAPIGVRNNNYLNIRPGEGYTWQGQIGVSNNFCRFKTVAWGVRAAIKNLYSYYYTHNCDTVRKIISRWAPPGDNNDTEGYIAHVVNETGFSANQKLAFDYSTAKKILRSMSAMEVGAAWRVTNGVFNAAWLLVYPGAAVGKIFLDNPPGKNECRDGKFSDKFGRGVCSRHGGLLLQNIERKLTREEVEKGMNELTNGMYLVKLVEFHPTGATTGTGIVELTDVRALSKNNEWRRVQYGRGIFRVKEGRVYFDLIGRFVESPSLAAVGAITPRAELFPCENGEFSTSNGRGACRSRGGLKSKTPVTFGNGSARLPIEDVLLSDVDLDTKLYQGRDSKYSERSVTNILDDVAAGRFVWENLDPITLYKTPDGKLVILSGHSRFEAFRRLAGHNVVVDGKDFTRIPAKILTKADTQTARRVALESNTLSTKETDTERAQYYRRRLELDDQRDVLADVKKNEGRNWTNIWAFAHLNPDGATWAAMRQFGASEDQSGQLMKILAKWIGTARLKFDELTDAHENELFAWLFQQKGYGTGRGQVNSERDFLDAVYRFIERIRDFDKNWAEKPLNIQSQLSKSPTETQFDAQLDTAKNAALEIEAEMKAKIRSLAQRGASNAEVQRIVEPMQRELTRRRLEYQNLLTKRAQVIEYSKNEATLFGIGKIYRGGGGKYYCRDRGYMTDQLANAACSWHGGLDNRTNTNAALRAQFKRELRLKGYSQSEIEHKLKLRGLNDARFKSPW